MTGPPLEPGAWRLGKLLAAQVARAERDYARAAALYRDVLAANPDAPSLKVDAYGLLAAQGDIPGAAVLAKELLGESGPHHPTAILVAAVDDAAAGRWAEAATWFEEDAGSRGFAAVLTPLARGWIAFGAGDTEAALDHVARMYQVTGLEALYHFHTGLMHDLSGNVETAAKDYRAVVEAPGGLSLRAVSIMGTFHVAQGRLDEAESLIEAYEDAHPGSLMARSLRTRLENFATAEPKPPRPITTPAAGLAEALFGVAASLNDDRALDLSLLLTQLALHLDPDQPLAQVLLGNLFDSQERHEEANAIYASIQNLADLDVSLRIRIATNMAKLDREEDALAQLRAIAADFPALPDPWVEIGDLYRVSERFAEAAAAYDEAIARLGPPEPQHWSLFYTRGIAYERAKDWDKAEADLLKALDLFPDQPLVLNYLGYSWLEQRVRLDEAQAMIERAVMQRPTDGYIVDSLGWVLYVRGRYEEAVTYLEKAVELEPADPVINDHLGDAYWRIGRRLQARYQWERVLTLDGAEPGLLDTVHEKLRNGLPEGPSIDHAAR